ncbi:MAG: RNA polymerase sigma factor [Gemmatimonadaceae bacterium]
MHRDESYYFVHVIPPELSPARTPTADDLALVQRVAGGDPLALSALYDRQAQAVHSHAFHLMGDIAEAEDAVEETFWRVWRRAGEYDPAMTDVDTWLLLICRQRCTERLGVKKRSLDRLPEDTTGLHFDVPPGGAPTREAERISAALASVPADQRTVLELAFFRGLGPADVASVTKQSPETARTRLRVAMRKLRDALAAPAAGPDTPAAETAP